MTTNDKVTVAVTGISGYGHTYISALLNAPAEKNIELCAVIDSNPGRCEFLEEIKGRGIPVFTSIEKFYEQNSVDLMILSTPIHCHASQSCLAMEHSSCVLCEKPLCATIEEAKQMRMMEEKTGKFTAIGYQWSFSDAVQKLKHDILAGDFGQALSMKTLVLWPRRTSYYQRNSWAGRIKNDQGDWILDSPVNNATAHYLHNMLYLLGDNPQYAAEIADVQAELYRAKDIENYDTAMIRCHTTAGVEVVFLSSHAVAMATGPLACYEFEKADIYFESRGGSGFTARFKDGSRRSYGSPDSDSGNKIWQSVDAVRNGNGVVCSVKSAMPHVICVNGAQESMSKIIDFPEDIIRRESVNDDNELVWVDGLNEIMIQCYKLGLLPSEHGSAPWSVSGKRVQMPV